MTARPRFARAARTVQALINFAGFDAIVGNQSSLLEQQPEVAPFGGPERLHIMAGHVIGLIEMLLKSVRALIRRTAARSAAHAGTSERFGIMLFDPASRRSCAPAWMASMPDATRSWRNLSVWPSCAVRPPVRLSSRH